MSAPKPGFNHWLWSGPLVAFAGFVSYFLLFAKWASTRDVPWVNLPLVWAGAGMTLWGARLALKRGGWRIAAGGVASLAALFFAGLLTVYVFVLSSQMPAVTEASDTGAEVPALTLPAHDGTAVNLRQASTGKLVLVFYRGAW